MGWPSVHAVMAFDIFKIQNLSAAQKCGGFWVHQKGSARRYEYLSSNCKRERGFTMKMKEGDVFESLLDGTEYVVKDIVNKMVVLQSRKRDKQIITGIETLKIRSFYREREKNVNE